jgi:hypothetical protein
MARYATIRRRGFIPIPKKRDTHVKVEINSIDETKLVRESSWIKPVTLSLGSLSLKLNNAGGKITNKYKEGQVIKFYADNTDNTTLQFQGRIDYIKDVLIKEGHFLEIEGRHRAYILNETKVNYKTSALTEISVILKAIIDQLPDSYGFTYDNVNATSEIKTKIEWSYTPFWDAVIFLCKKANFDCYVDNDLDFHFFEQGSVENNDEAIVEGQNFLKTNEIGTDDYYEKTRVIGIGRMDDGITPIVYTAISDGEGDEIREVKIEDSTLNTMDSVQAFAEGELLDLENRPKQASILSYGLETLEPGEKIWFSIPRQLIHSQFRIIQLTHKFGREGWRTECMIEKELKGMEDLINKTIRTENMLSGTGNTNKLNFSFNLSFSDDDLTLVHDNTQISNGSLELKSGTEGTWTSKTKIASDNITSVELRFIGKDLTDSKFYFSADGGSTWQEVSKEVLTTPNHTGLNLKAKIELVKNTSNPWPSVESMAILFS